MPKFVVTNEIRKDGAIGIFWWDAPATVEADNEERARDANRERLRSNGYESRGVRCREVCEGCDDTGIRPDSPNHYGVTVPDGYVVIERCDTCQRYADDWAAAQAYGSALKVYTPGTDEWTPVAKPR